ncbi:MAG: HAD family hydrolase [Brevinema sp.]
MLKVSLYDFDRTIYAYDTGTRIYFYLFKKKPWLLLYIPHFLMVSLLHICHILPHNTWKNLMLVPMKRISLVEWRRLVRGFWKEAKKDFFPSVVQAMQDDKAKGMEIGIISASLELFLEPIKEILKPDFIIGTKIKINGNKILNRIEGENCKMEAKVRYFHAHMAKNYPEKQYILHKMTSDSLHDLPLYEIAENQWVVDKNGALEPGLPQKYSVDMMIK